MGVVVVACVQDGEMGVVVGVVASLAGPQFSGDLSACSPASLLRVVEPTWRHLSLRQTSSRPHQRVQS